jgi:hypothetical protein
MRASTRNASPRFRHAPGERGGAHAAIEHHVRAGLDQDGVGREHVHDHLEIARIAQLDQRGSSLHHGLALLHHAQHLPRDRGADFPTLVRTPLGSPGLRARERRARC